MPVFRSRARAAVATLAAALVTAAVPVAAAPAAAVEPVLTAQLTGSCPWLVRGTGGQPVEITVTNDTDEAYDATLVPVLPDGMGASGITPGMRVPAHGVRTFRAVLHLLSDVPKDIAPVAFDVVTPADGTVRVQTPFQVVGAPGAPTGVTAVEDDTTAVVAWTPPSSNFDHDFDFSRPTAYEVTASPGGATTVVAGTEATATVGGLVNGTAYTFTVTAHGYFGSTASAPSEPVTPAGVPRPVTGVTATGSGSTRTVSWSPADGNGSAVTGYTVTSHPGGAQTTAPGDATSVEVTGVTDDTTFTVRAVNGIDGGYESTVAAFAGTLAAAWDDDNGGAVLDITSDDPPAAYDIEVRPEGFVQRYVTTGAVAGEPWRSPLKGLPTIYGSTYSFRVRAVVDDVAGPWSDATAPVASRDSQPSPPDFTAVAGHGGVYLCVHRPWTRGGTLTKYVVTATDATDDSEKTVDLNPTTSVGVVPGLVNGHPYTLTMRSVGSLGTSDASSDWTGFPVTPTGPPSGFVTGVTAVPSNAAATVSWTPFAGDDHDSYEVVAHPGGQRVLVPKTASSAVLFGLTNGTASWFSVRGVGRYGAGPAVVGGQNTTPGLPHQVTDVTVTLDERLATLSWTAPDTNGGPVTGYKVYRNFDGAVATVGADTTTTTITLPSFGTPYVLRVAAVNDTGIGPLSEPTDPLTPADTTPPVVSVEPAAPFSAQHDITVRYAATDTGSGVKNYDVRYRVARYDGAFGAYRYPAARQATTTKSAVVAPPTAGYTYCWSVRARDGLGNVSEWSPDACTASALDDRSLTASASWSRVDNTRYYRIGYTATTKTGAALTKAGVSTDRLAIVGTQCATCGRVAVYIGGTFVGRVSFQGATTAYRQVYAFDLGTVRTGTVKIVAAGRVYIDGLGIAKP